MTGVPQEVVQSGLAAAKGAAVTWAACTVEVRATAAREGAKAAAPLATGAAETCSSEGSKVGTLDSGQGM